MVVYRRCSKGYRADRLHQAVYLSAIFKIIILTAFLCTLSFNVIAQEGGISECFHHYNPEAWRGEGLAIVMCEQTPDMTACVLKNTSGVKLADLDKHGNKDRNRYVWTLYDTLGSTYPYPLDIVCQSTGGNEYIFKIDDGSVWEDGDCTAQSCTGEIPPPVEAKPEVGVVAVDANAAETNAETGRYRISRSGDTSSDLAVFFTMSGTARAGEDYHTLNSPVTIPSGSSYTDLTLTPIDDSIREKDETAVLTISANGDYELGTRYNARITIEDNDGIITAIYLLLLGTDK